MPYCVPSTCPACENDSMMLAWVSSESTSEALYSRSAAAWSAKPPVCSRSGDLPVLTSSSTRLPMSVQLATSTSTLMPGLAASKRLATSSQYSLELVSALSP